MSTPELRIAPTLALPRDVITQTVALLAVRRAGKSNGAAVLAEVMYAAGLPWVAIDPKGDWWGLRSNADGTGPGLPIPIFGGLHGDMPLLPEAGHLIADLIVEQNLTCILDVSDFPSKAAQARFLTDLGERLFRLHGRRPQPRHLFLEEADDFLPQRVMREMARCVGIWTKIVKQGGQRGLGATIISQRSAVVNKDALTQTGTLIVLRTTSPQDRKAILEWVSYHAVARELVDSLPGLDDGEAWVCSPQWLAKRGDPPIQRIRFDQRVTFDSGATPTMEIGSRPPATLADIDLGALTARMEAVVVKAAADDPRALRKRVADLERQLRGKAPACTHEPQIEALRAELAEANARPPVEIPVLQPGELAAFEQGIAGLRDTAAGLELALSRAARPATVRPAPPVPAAATPAPGDSSRYRRSAITDGPPGLKAGARRMLAVLARQYPLTATRPQLAALAGMKRTGGTFQSYFSALRTGGLISETAGVVSITDEGLAVAGVDPGTAPMTMGEIREMWRGVLKAGARLMLDHLLAIHPDGLSRDQLAEAAGLERSGGTFQSYLSTLRSNGLADVAGDEVRAADVFFLAVR